MSPKIRSRVKAGLLPLPIVGGAAACALLRSGSQTRGLDSRGRFGYVAAVHASTLRWRREVETLVVFLAAIGGFIALAFVGGRYHLDVLTPLAYVPVIVVGAALLRWLRRGALFGPLLLNMGSQVAQGYLILVLAPVVVSVVFLVLLFFLRTDTTISEIVMLVTFATVSLTIGFTSHEIRERGICSLVSCLRWDDIARWEWGLLGNQLIVEVRRPLLGYRVRTFLVLPSLRETVESLVRERVAANA